MEGNTLAYAARDSSGHLSFWKFDRREVGPNDVEFTIKVCGICHGDLHQIKSEWRASNYPLVPGHELAGEVTKIGSAVTGFTPGMIVGVGCMVNACMACSTCDRDLQQFCKKCLWTYGGKDWDGNALHGGYSSKMVCDAKFVLRMPTTIPLDNAAPLLCAGVTIWSPLKHFKMDQPGGKLGVQGLGGLGHMAVKLGKALGQEVTVISTSANKEKEAKEVLGADHFIISKDPEAMAAAAESLDYIIDTVPAKHDLMPLLGLLKIDGKLVLVGVPPEPFSLKAENFIGGRKIVTGSLIGGIKETQEMLDFCGEHKIGCEIEKIPVTYVNTAMERLFKADVKYRFVIDIEGSLKDESATS